MKMFCSVLRGSRVTKFGWWERENKIAGLGEEKVLLEERMEKNREGSVESETVEGWEGKEVEGKS